MTQSVAERFDGMFRGAIGALRRRGPQAGDRAHHQDAPFTAFTHLRKNRLGHANYSEEIRFELPPPVLHAQILDGADIDKTRVVDQHVDRTRLLLDGRNGLLHRTVVTYVHFQRFKRESLLSCQYIELRTLLRRTSRRKNTVASLGEQERGGLPQYIRSTGDSHRYRCSLLGQYDS